MRKLTTGAAANVVAMALLLLLSILSPGGIGHAASQPAAFGHWPAGASPRDIGKRVAERFAASPRPDTTSISYPETITWYGSLTFAQLTGDRSLQARLKARFDPLLSTMPSGVASHGRHVDYSVSGSVPLELFIQTRDPKYLQAGKQIADRQWEKPTPEGLTGETRFWIDDMYMITLLQVQAYRATRDSKYLDRAALEMTTYLHKLQQPNGLFYHAPDVPFFWGRGNGWVAAGMAELLRSLPKDHPQRTRILDGYRKMMASLLQFQAADGMWRQVLDHPESWPESSCTGMFTFALVTGVRNGWLDAKTYSPAARKGWLALVNHLDANADISDVCEGTNKKNSLEYYLARRRLTGNLHGQAPIIWTASALLR